MTNIEGIRRLLNRFDYLDDGELEKWVRLILGGADPEVVILRLEHYEVVDRHGTKSNMPFAGGN